MLLWCRAHKVFIPSISNILVVGLNVDKVLYGLAGEVVDIGASIAQSFTQHKNRLGVDDINMTVGRY